MRALLDSNLEPSVDATYDLGTSTYRWRDLYLAGTVKTPSVTVASVRDSLVQDSYLLNSEFADEDGDGIPDGWSVTLYTGGSFSLDTDSVFGKYSVKFTKPAGTSYGGGHIISKPIPVDRNHKYFVGAYVKASDPNLIVYIGVRQLDANKNHIAWGPYVVAKKTGYGDSWTFDGGVFSGSSLDPQTKYVQVVLIGGYTGSEAGGDVWFSHPIFRRTVEVPNLCVGKYEVITSGRVLQNIASVGQSLTPSSNNAYDLGSSSYKWRTVYANQVVVGDLVFANGWRVVEKGDELVLVSPKGKRYRLALVEDVEEGGGGGNEEVAS